MDDFDLPDDLKDSVEVVYLDNDEYIEDENVDMEDIQKPENEEEPGEVIDLAELTFSKHEKSVFSCDLSADGTLAVTGGEDDMAYVWSTLTGEVMLECTGHKDSVTEACFSYDCQLIATGDMGGLIQVWNLKDEKLIWCYEGDDLEWLQWHPLTNVLMSGTQTGNIYIWQIPQGTCKVLPSTGSSTTCAKILPDGKKIIAGYNNGQVKLWDIKTTTALWQYNDCDESGITSLDITKDGSLAAIAPSAKIIKVSDGKLTRVLLAEGETDVESVCFNSELNVLVTGAISGQLCVWDYGRNTIRHQAKIECAVTSLKWCQKYKLLIGATDGAIYVCDARTGTLSETLTGHFTDILCLSTAKNGTLILSGSDDGTAKMFNLKSDF